MNHDRHGDRFPCNSEVLRANIQAVGTHLLGLHVASIGWKVNWATSRWFTHCHWRAVSLRVACVKPQAERRIGAAVLSTVPTSMASIVFRV